MPAYRPQLATLAAAPPPAGPQFLAQLKHDGFRVGAVVERGTVRLLSRRGHSLTDRFARVAEALRQLDVESALLDGEVVALLPSGLSSFQALQNNAHEHAHSLAFYIFDLVHLGGEDIGARPLTERLELLRKLLSRPEVDQQVLRFCDYIVGDAPRVFTEACRLGAEGIVVKRVNSPYQPGRSTSWLKVKCARRALFVVGGFTAPGGSRSGIGALLVGYHDEQGALRYAGSVGTGKGFTRAFLLELRRQLEPLVQASSPFASFSPSTLRSPWGRRTASPTRWVRPVLVAEVGFTEHTADGLLRHPSLHTFRGDVQAREVTRRSPTR